MARVDPRQRPVPAYRDGEMFYEVRGAGPASFADLYHRMLRTTWPKLLAGFFGVYVVINLLFAVVYWAVGGVDGVRAARLDDAFWFSVQTLSTIGYGGMAPASPVAHAVVVLESFVGIVYAAVATGVLFARMARPTARVVFSDRALITTRDGQPCLMFRVANRRRNQIVEARIRVSALIDEVTAEGEHLRRLNALPLVRDETPTFALSWTVIHPIDEDSPLFGLTEDNVASRLAAIVVVLAGTDDTFAQVVHARRWYRAQELCFGARFVDIMHFGEDGGLVMHLDRIHGVWWPDDED